MHVFKKKKGEKLEQSAAWGGLQGQGRDLRCVPSLGPQGRGVRLARTAAGPGAGCQQSPKGSKWKAKRIFVRYN